MSYTLLNCDINLPWEIDSLSQFLHLQHQKKLMHHGFVPGTEIKILKRQLGFPLLIEIKKITMILDKEDAQYIVVKPTHQNLLINANETKINS